VNPVWAGIILIVGGVCRADDLADLVAGPVEKVVGDCAFTEGPAWHPDGYLLFSDIPNDRILRVAVDGTSTEWLKPSSGANGLMCDRQGNVYACQGEARRIALLRTGSDGKGMLVKPLVAEFDSKPFNKPNDLAIDNAGGLYFTDPNYRQQTEPPTQPVQGVYYIARDGAVTRVIDDLPRPNGILVSADGKTLYVANIELRQVMRYAITGPGQIGAGEVLFTGDETTDGRGPDGMSLDADGRLYCTYKSVVVLTAAGELIGRISVPEKPANCAFGGDDNRTLYITAQKSLYKVAMKVAGTVLPSRGPGATEVAVRDLKLSVPAAWTQEEPSNRLRLAQFAIAAAEGEMEQAELVISGPFGGSDGANIDRWLAQFDAEERKVAMTQGTSPQGEYIVVDLSGTYHKSVGPPVAGRTEPAPGYRMLGVILKTKGNGNYFLKLTGPSRTVATAAESLRHAFGADPLAETEYKPSEQ
jgi:gluconolactonase